MNKILYKIFLCYLLTLPLFAEANVSNEEIEVRPVEDELIETNPQSVVTAVFRITNVTCPAQQFVSELQLPTGWKLITQDFPFPLDMDQTEIKLVSFYVPAFTLAGRYELTYRVKSRDNPSISDQYSIDVCVLSVRKMDIYVIEKPDYVIAGDDYTVSYQVKNLSNQKESFHVDFSHDEKFQIILNQKNFTLTPGNSITISVTVKTKVDIKRQLKHNLYVSVVSDIDKEVKAKVTSRVSIIPKDLSQRLPYHTIPVNVSFRSFYSYNMKDRSGYQLDIKGQGSLDDKGKNKITFHLRGPNAYGKSVLAKYDEYNASFSNDKFSIKAGDNRYSLSFLTENSRYGRGVETRFKSNSFEVGAFYQKSRWMYGPSEEIASFVNYYINENSNIGLNYINKRTHQDTSNIYSIEGDLKLFGDTRVRLESSAGKSHDKMEYAHWLNISGSEFGVHYTMRYIFASDDFPGYYRDTKYLTANFSLPILKNLRFNTCIRNQKRNFDLDTTNYSAPLTKHYSIGLRYYFKSALNFTFQLQKRSSKDRLPDHLFDYVENGILFRMNTRFKYFGFSLSAEKGKTYNEILDKTSSMARLRVSSTISPNKWQRYSIYGMFDKSSRYRLGNNSRFTLGVNLNLKFANRMSCYLNYQTNTSTEEYYQDRNLLEGNFSYRFSNNHRLSIRCRQTLIQRSLNKKETAVMLNYSASLNIPISLKKNVGTIRGEVYDIESGKPVENMIIRLNNFSVVTNEDGKFIFSSLYPNNYLLSVDKSSIGLNMITIPETPLKFKINGGDDQFVELGLIRGAGLTGQISFYKYVNPGDSSENKQKIIEDKREYYLVGKGKDGKSLYKDGGVFNIIVEISNNDKLLRRVTDKNGKFEFLELKPGKWKVKFYDDGLPIFHKFEKDKFELDIKPGEKKELKIRVFPIIRKIRFKNNGGTLKEKTKEQIEQKTRLYGPGSRHHH